MAIPLIPYLYAVDSAEQVPATANRSAVFALRDQYRRSWLPNLVPDTATGEAPAGDWIQLIGAAYDRQIIALSVTTTPQQDDALIAELNGRKNTVRFNLLFRNCADFARDIVNLYYPKALRNNVIADLGLLNASVIPHVPGSRSESSSARGVLESLVKTKKYAVPLAVVQPWLPVGFAAAYLATGRFKPERLATARTSPTEIQRRALDMAIAQ